MLRRSSVVLFLLLVPLFVAAQFGQGTVRVEGRVDWPGRNFETGMVRAWNTFTGEDMPVVFAIDGDGRFEVEFPVWHRGVTELEFDGVDFGDGSGRLGYVSIDIYAEAGSKVEVVVGRDGVTFGGDFARENREIRAFRRDKALDSRDDWRVFLAHLSQVMEGNLGRLEGMRGDISEEAYGWLRYREQALFVEQALRYENGWRRGWNRGTPVPAEFYGFLRDMPLDDPGFIAAGGNSVVNFIKFMGPLYYPGEPVITQTLDDGREVAYIRSDFIDRMGGRLSDDERWWVTFDIGAADSTGRKRWVETRRAFWPKLQELLVEYAAQAEYPEVMNQRARLAHADSAWCALMGRAPGLMMDAVAVNLLSGQTREDIHRATEAFVGEPFLRAEIWKHYERVAPKTTGAVPLPEGQGAEVVRRITERFRGKPVLLYFWGTTCGPCVAKLRATVAERRRTVEKGDMALIYLSAPEYSPRREEYEKFVAENELTGAMFVSQDDWNKLCALFGFRGTPRYVLLDAEGNVLHNDHGGSFSFGM